MTGYTKIAFVHSTVKKQKWRMFAASVLRIVVCVRLLHTVGNRSLSGLIQHISVVFSLGAQAMGYLDGKLLRLTIVAG